ncbi:hypothetical protein [Sphingomonas sp. UYP23]
MNTSNLMAGASRFAHLAGFSRKARGAADDDQQEDQAKGKRSKASDDDDDDDQAKGKGSRASDDDGDDDQAKGKRSKASDDDDDDDQAKGKRSKASDDDDDDDQPKGKRSRASDDDDDDDDDEKEMHGRSSAASARRREQARITHILSSKHAAANLPLAVSLACETRMPRREAVSVLKGQAAVRPDRDYDDDRGNRHARNDRSSRNVALGGDAALPSDKKAIDSSWGSAFAKAGVPTR